MVGERYRDLIDAADSILIMKKNSENITKSVQQLQTLCMQASRVPPEILARTQLNSFISSSLSSSSSSSANLTVNGKIGNNNNNNIKANQNRTSISDSTTTGTKALFDVALQMKLLVDAPERIWSALEAKQHLLAAQLFLKATQAHADFTADPDKKALAASFPILRQQWTAISQFRDQILSGARSQFAFTFSTANNSSKKSTTSIVNNNTTNTATNPVTTATVSNSNKSIRNSTVEDAIETIVLLDRKSHHQVLVEFLEWRRRSLLKYFSINLEGLDSVSLQFSFMLLVVKVSIYLLIYLNFFFS